MADELDAILAHGPAPTQQPDVAGQILGTLKSQQGLQQGAADIKRTEAETAFAKAQSAQLGAATRGADLENALKQRAVDAQKTVTQLLQKNTVRNADGSTSTDMASTLAGLRAAGFPEYAMELEAKNIANEKSSADMGKAQLDLAAGKTKLAGLRIGLSGIDRAQNPQERAQIYNTITQQAQKEGWADQLPASPQDFAKNPSAYTGALSDIVNSSGSKTEVLQQRKSQIEATQQRLAQARNQFSNLVQQISDPRQYPLVLQQIRQDNPEEYAQLNLAPADSVRSPEDLNHVKEASVFTQLPPDQQQSALTAKKAQASMEALQGAEGTRARAEAGLASTQAAIARTVLGQNYGVDLKGSPLAPAAANGATNAPVINPPGKGALDLSKFGPWTAEPPIVQRAALNILATGDAPGVEPAAVSRAQILASKIDPQWKSNVNAREHLWTDAQTFVTAANTAVAHSPDLVDYAKELNNRFPHFMNTKIADLKSQFGSEVQAQFDNRVNRYNGEIEKMMHGGVPTIPGLSEGLKSGASREKTVGQLLGIVQDNNRMIAEKGEKINNQYNKQLGGNILGGGVDVLQPETRQILSSQSGARQKVATEAHLAEYAKQKGISPGQARKEFEGAGYQIKSR